MAQERLGDQGGEDLIGVRRLMTVMFLRSSFWKYTISTRGPLFG